MGKNNNKKESKEKEKQIIEEYEEIYFVEESKNKGNEENYENEDWKGN